MLTSPPESPRPRPRVTELAKPADDHPYRNGAEVVTDDGRSLPLVSATLRGTAQGGIARLTLEQRFENRWSAALHVTYRMPLPADGAVSGYAFVLAGRSIVGRVQRRQEARERFERAVAAGHTAALLVQERADIFTQSIGNLPAGQALIAQITIDQRLTWLPEGEWELRFPTVIGPRYVGADDRPEDVSGTQVATAPGGLAARIQIAIAIRDALSSGRTPSSPSHALATRGNGVVELRQPAGARLDRDLVVRWPVAGPTTGMSLATMRPERSDDCFGLVTIVPPAPAARPRTLPRDLIVLIDTSGSMAGRPLTMAKRVLALLIESLGDGDRLELIEFSSEPRRYKPRPVAATRDEKRDAVGWLRALSAGGGTEMRTAVIAALQLLRPGVQRQVVIATDGYIGGDDRLVAALYAGLPASCRLHFVGIGSSVNRSLATAMARAGRGTEVICDLDADPERAVRRLLDHTRSPVLTDITLDGSAVIARAPDAVADVYAGSPVVAAVQLGAGELIVRGRTADGVWERRLRVGMPRPGDGDPAIAALFGRERIADLEARGVAGDDRDAEIERIGLAFQIATRFTPFIAVDESHKIHPAVHHRAVPQELPHGTTAAAFGLRAAATTPVAGVPVELAGDVDTARIAPGLAARAGDIDTARFAHGLARRAGAVPADDEDSEDAFKSRSMALVDGDELAALTELAAQFATFGRAASGSFAIDAPGGDDDLGDNDLGDDELFAGRASLRASAAVGPTDRLDLDLDDALEEAVFPGEEDEKELGEEFGEERGKELGEERGKELGEERGEPEPRSPGEGAEVEAEVEALDTDRHASITPGDPAKPSGPSAARPMQPGGLARVARVTAKLPAWPGGEPTPPASPAPSSADPLEPREAPELRRVPRPRPGGDAAAPAVPPAVRKPVLRWRRPLLLALLAVAAVLAALLWRLVG